MCVVPSYEQPSRLWIVASLEAGRVHLTTVPGTGEPEKLEVAIDDIEPPKANRRSNQP